MTSSSAPSAESWRFRLQATAAASAAVAMLLIAFWWWDTRALTNGPSPAVLGVQLLIRAVAVAAAFGPWVLPMFLAFAAAFVPFGLYLLGSPSYLALAGVADLVYLAAAIAMLAVRGRARA